MGAQNFARKTRHLDGVFSLTVFGPNSACRRRASALVKPGSGYDDCGYFSKISLFAARPMSLVQQAAKDA